jgi:hypothetical protein
MQGGAEHQGNFDCCMSRKGHLDALSVEEQSSQRQDPHIGGGKVSMAEARCDLHNPQWHNGIAAKHAGNKGITRRGRCGAEESCWRWLGSAPSVVSASFLTSI